MAVAGHRVFPVLVVWLLVQLTHSGADSLGYSLLRCGSYDLQQPFKVMAQDSVTVQWCLEICATNVPPYEYGALRRSGGGNSQAACFCVTKSVPSHGNGSCPWRCGSGGGLQCGGKKNGVYISVYQDVDECLTNKGGCNQTCVNSPGSFSCQCREGYDEAGPRCTDIDECDTDNGGCAQHCTNTLGSYSCSCDDGYIVNNTACHDINECAINSGGCDHTCTNTPGGYNCSCLDGYVSNNTTCTDIDECADPAIQNCSPTDECRNTNGSFQCLPKAVDTTVSSTVTEKTTEMSAGAQGGGEGGLNPGLIAGVCVAAVAAITAVVVVVLVVLRRRRAKPEGYISGMDMISAVPEGTIQGRSVNNTAKSKPVALVVGTPVNSVTQPATNTDQDTEIRQPTDPGTTRDTEVASDAAKVEVVYQNYDPQVKVNMFVDHVNHLKQHKNFEDEFNKLGDASDHSCAAAKRSGVAAKNKYKNMLPYDETRVKLKTLDDDPLTDYINASLIKGFVDHDEFIACMGPINTTVDDFWRMIWERDVPLIVMVTNMNEGGREKCALYWPVDEEIEYGDIRVRPVKEDKWLDIVRRQFTLTQGTERRTVLHLQYTAWPDKSVPSNATSMVNFVRQVGKQMKSNKPTVVHCSAGVGRTGTLIALYQLLHQANRKGVVDVFNCIKKLREQRTTMVQTLKQYVFIHDALAEYLTTGSTLMSIDVFTETYKDIVKPGADETSAIDRQFKIIQDTTKTLSEYDQDDALSKGNAAKNRDKAILPRMTHRVYLRERYSGRNAYINAVTVNGYRKPDSFYVTEIPLETTVIDFWRMVSENDCRSIVLLMHDGDEKEMSRMLPDKSTPLLVAGRHVTQTGSTTGGSHQIIDLTMTEAEEENEGAATYANVSAVPVPAEQPGKEDIKLKVFKLCTKRQDELAIDDVISLHSDVETWQRSSGDQPVVVSCLNGASLSGLYVVSCNIFEMADTEGEVDIFQLVRQAKESRPEFINSKNQYNMLYAALESHLKKYGNYANYN